TATTELNAAYKGAGTVTPSAPAAVQASATAGDWPSYNKTLTSERYSQLSEINTKNAAKLKVLCTYDTGAPRKIPLAKSPRIWLGDRARSWADRERAGHGAEGLFRC